MPKKSAPRVTTNEQLRYVGPTSEAGVLPLAEGWPAEDHAEADEHVRGEKLASGHYETQDMPAAPAEE